MFTAICKRIGVWVVQKGRLYLLLGVLCLLGSVTLTANAILTVSNSGMFGDADVTVDSAGTLNVGTASSTVVVIGKSGIPVTIPGNVAINGTLTLGSASTTGQLLFHIASSSFTTLLQASSSQASNLTFTLPTTSGTAAQAMLTDGAGNLFFGNPGSSQWLNGTSGTISYSSGSIGINTTTPLALLSVVGSASSTAPLFDIASSSGTSLFRVNPNGTVTIGTTLPTVLGDGVSALTCPGKFASLTACLDAAKTFVTTNEDGTGKALRILISQGTYALTSYPYSLASGMQIYGVSPRPIFTTIQDGSFAPNGGTWIDCGGSQCFGGNNLAGVILNGLGFKNFGAKGMSFGGNNVEGASDSQFIDLTFYGSPTLNASGIAFENFNFAHATITKLYGEHFNTALHLVSQNNSYYPGNSIITDVEVMTYDKSAANGNASLAGILAETLAPSSGSTHSLLYLTFVKPEVLNNGGDGTGVAIIFNGIISSQIYDADLEGSLRDGVFLTGSSAQNLFGVTTSSATNTVHCDTSALYNIALAEASSITFLDDAGAAGTNSRLGKSMAGNFNITGNLSLLGLDSFHVRPLVADSQLFTIQAHDFSSSIYGYETAGKDMELDMINPAGAQNVNITTNQSPKFPGGADNTVVCWKALAAGGRRLGYATVAEITAGTCH